MTIVIPKIIVTVAKVLGCIVGAGVITIVLMFAYIGFLFCLHYER